MRRVRSSQASRCPYPPSATSPDGCSFIVAALRVAAAAVAGDLMAGYN